MVSKARAVLQQPRKERSMLREHIRFGDQIGFQRSLATLKRSTQNNAVRARKHVDVGRTNRATATALAVVANHREAYRRWSAIVVHHSASGAGKAATLDAYHRTRRPRGLAYHFVTGNGHGLDDGAIEAGGRWIHQQPGAHVVSTLGGNRHLFDRKLRGVEAHSSSADEFRRMLSGCKSTLCTALA